jgi:hypothetical protein
MRVAIVSAGRFHILDLARELDACGHDVALYSLVPPWRTRGFGLPRRCNRWLGPHIAPVYALYRTARQAGRASAANRLLYAAVDRVAANVLGACDVVIGMSQMSAASMQRAQALRRARRARTRQPPYRLAARHPESIPGRAVGEKPVPDWAVRRELAEYDIADFITVPSKHVERSFTEKGIAANKLFRNPYGSIWRCSRHGDTGARDPADHHHRRHVVAAQGLRRIDRRVASTGAARRPPAARRVVGRCAGAE